MTNDCNIPHPLKREGLSQHERYPTALDSDYVKLDERSVNDLLRQSAEYARYINYYGNENPNVASDNWKAFFAEVYDYDLKKVKTHVLEGYKNSTEAPPHISLFMAFLNLFGFAQEQLNGLTGKHIDFFYKEVLQLTENDFEPDHAVVFMELNKNVEQALVKKDTFLKGGKDAGGRERFYKTLRDTVINRASVDEVKTLFLEKAPPGNTPNTLAGMYHYPIAKSKNGFGEAFEDEPSAWKSFGENRKIETTLIPDIGFAIASPVFDLPDGERTITLDTAIGLTKGIFEDTFLLRYSGPKGWITPASYGIDPNNPGKIVLKLYFGDPSFVPYNDAVHAWGLKTTQPVLLLTLKPTHKQYINGTTYTRPFRYSELNGIVVDKINISVSVKGSRAVVIQNDNGQLDPAKPFLPFGNLPVKDKSRFYVSSKRIFNKHLKKVIFKIDWKGRPDDLKEHYKDYYYVGTPNKYLIPEDHWDDIRATYIPGILEVLDRGQWVPLHYEKYKLELDCEVFWAMFINAYLSSQNLPANFPVPNRPLYAQVPADELIYENNGTLKSLPSNEAQPYAIDSKNSVARFTLNKDFGHLHFANLLTKRSHALLTPGNTGLALPNQPYTPELNSFSLNYELEATVNLENPDNQSTFFHIHPYGFQQVSKRDALVPTYNSEGNLYIGISGLTPPATVNLYFHFWEDSGDINVSLTKDDLVVWEYLAGDVFIPFPSANILENSTIQFTTSGIIRFAFPADASKPHTQLAADKHWIRGRVKANSAAYSMLIDIKSQACEVVFENRDNTLEHLAYGLPANSITKFESKLPEVKKAHQPFPSFGGRLEETSKAFYTRVSERLKHKNRAWEIKNYERLVLHNFANIYRVKCISHTTSTSEYAPGHVLIVPVPKMVNAVTQNPLQPRVKLSQLFQIKEFLQNHMSEQATVEIVNPVFEEVWIDCGLKFKPGYNDEAIYKKELNDTLVRYLAPWINDDPSALNFGNRIYTSQLIKLVEEQEYVDYITRFEVKKMENGNKITVKNVIVASKESAILTSASKHIIRTDINC